MRTNRERAKTADEMYLEIVLTKGLSPAERAKRITALTVAANASIGVQCPECGCTSIEDNGEGGSHAEFHCNGCNHRFGPGAES